MFEIQNYKDNLFSRNVQGFWIETSMLELSNFLKIYRAVYFQTWINILPSM